MLYRPHTMNISGDIEFSCSLPYILTPPKLRYLQTPCTGGLPHLDEAIFGIFLIVITLHRLLDCAGSSCYFFSICDPPLIAVSVASNCPGCPIYSYKRVSFLYVKEANFTSWMRAFMQSFWFWSILFIDIRIPVFAIIYEGRV